MHLLRINVAGKLRQQVSCCLYLANNTKPHRKVGFYALESLMWQERLRKQASC